jgi:hypothetical protein
LFRAQRRRSAKVLIRAPYLQTTIAYRSIARMNHLVQKLGVFLEHLLQMLKQMLTRPVGHVVGKDIRVSENTTTLI